MMIFWSAYSGQYIGRRMMILRGLCMAFGKKPLLLIVKLTLVKDRKIGKCLLTDLISPK